MKRVWAVGLILACLGADKAAAWGQEGHSIVAELAQRRLSATAAAEIQRLLKSELSPSLAGPISLASVASWADDWRASHKETSNWHFVDIPIDRHDGTLPADVRYDEKLDCPPVGDPEGTCIVIELAALVSQLKAKDAPGDADAMSKRVQALKFVTHLVGDLHQPLHCAERDGDAGGNDFHIFYSGPHQGPAESRTNFHRVWDTLILIDRDYAWGSYAARIEKDVLKTADEVGLGNGSFADWANECHKAALEAYALVPSDLTLTNKQLSREFAITDKMLAEGGVRLARVLNDALGGP